MYMHHAHIKRWAIDLRIPVNFSRHEFEAKLQDIVVCVVFVENSITM